MVIRSHGHTVIRIHSHPVIRPYGHTVTRSYGHTVIRSHGHTDIRPYAHTDTQSYGHTAIWSYGHSHAIFTHPVTEYATVCQKCFSCAHFKFKKSENFTVTVMLNLFKCPKSKRIHGLPHAHPHANFITPTRNHCHIWQHLPLDIPLSRLHSELPYMHSRPC
jgi:hypothetical protein